MVAHVAQIDLLGSFDAACLIGGKILCAMHDIEEVRDEQFRFLPSAPDESNLAGEFMERYPDNDFPNGYGNRRILVTFECTRFDDEIHERILKVISAIVGDYDSRSDEPPLCFDTFFFQLNAEQ